MPSPQHRNLLTQIAGIDLMPDDASRYSDWLDARAHLNLLKQNANSDEVIVFALSRHAFVHAVIIDRGALDELSHQELLDWSGNPICARAGFCWGGGRSDVWVDETTGIWSTIPDEHIQQLLFARTFHGLTGDDAVSYEILQEYLHVSEIFWRPERSAYCCFDEHGDFSDVVSITTKGTNSSISLVTFQREQLEQYLVASKSVLVRMFDFTFFRPGEFDRWSDDPEMTRRESDKLVYRQKIEHGKASYTRGVQIVSLSRPRSEIFESIRNGRNPADENPGVEFVALDWRNKRLTNISTHPSATTNCFQAYNNSLPYEISPVFFRPEVLHKYKADRDKYIVSEENRTISCRGSWDLQTYDINEEGQVHTYICYLRTLPHDEQLYWRSFNEKPKSGISERAFQADFEGEWSDIITPLEKVLHIARTWADSDSEWWSLQHEVLLERVNTPRSSSRDEWARAFSDLAKLIVEGFQVKAIRSRLEKSSIAFELEEKSLKLMERFLIAHNALADGMRLSSLRTVQDIRSKVSSHYGGSTAVDLANSALMEHESYTAHFESVCEGLAQELEMIEKAFS